MQGNIYEEVWLESSRAITYKYTKIFIYSLIHIILHLS